jgi:Fe2+ or Zn2+ uptake regulation protein
MTQPLSQARLPKNYRLLLDIIVESGFDAHVTTSDVFTEARRRQPGIGFSTVYRGLSRLSSMGLISEVTIPGLEAAAYEVPKEPHAHFLCRVCGHISDVPYMLPREDLARLEARNGFTVESDAITLNGRCTRCQAGTRL